MDYVDLLLASSTPRFLVSAYDVDHCADEGNLKKFEQAFNQQRLILLDSGNYESFWREDLRWTKARYYEVLKSCPWQAALSFDVICAGGTACDACAQQIAESAFEDQQQSSGTTIIPIVHSRGSEILPSLCQSVQRLLNPIGIAVPERELGDGLFTRIRTVKGIRQSLDLTGSNCFLHLLGTGNPWSILLYAAAGADTFDGLEWCQTVVDPNTGLLLHFQQRELLQKQLTLAGVNTYDMATLMHNLLFYSEWMTDLQIASEGVHAPLDLIRRTLGAATAERVEKLLNEE